MQVQMLRLRVDTGSAGDVADASRWAGAWWRAGRFGEAHAGMAVPPDVQALFQHYFETKLADEPEFATTTGHYENSDRWNDWSKAGRDSRKKHAEETLSGIAEDSGGGIDGDGQRQRAVAEV